MSFCECAGEDKQITARRNFVGVGFFLLKLNKRDKNIPVLKKLLNQILFWAQVYKSQ